VYLQRTAKKEIGCASIGLHTGRKINMKIKPACVDEGIVFVRKDVSNYNFIKADIHNVFDTQLATTIGINGTRVSTVEHILSAFSGMGLDNAVVEVFLHTINGTEILRQGKLQPQTQSMYVHVI